MSMVTAPPSALPAVTTSVPSSISADPLPENAPGIVAAPL